MGHLHRSGHPGRGGDIWDTSTTNWTVDNGNSNIAWDNFANAADTALFTTGTGRSSLAEDIFLRELAITSTNTSTISGQAMVHVFGGPGRFQFGSQQGVIDVTGVGLRNNQIDNDLVGSGGLVVNSVGGGTGDGRLILAGDNSGLGGGIRIDSGLLGIASSSALGANTVTLNGGGIFGPVNRSGPTATINGPTNLVIGNDVVINDVAGSLIRVWGGRNLLFTGEMSGGGGFAKTASGSAFIRTNTLTAPLTISGGHSGLTS